MVFCCDGVPNEYLPTAQKIEKWISREDKPPQQFKEDIENVLRGLWVIASTPGLDEGFVKIPQRVAPVEFVFIGMSSSYYFHEVSALKSCRRCSIICPPQRITGSAG